jgi:hypothetical protein
MSSNSIEKWLTDTSKPYGYRRKNKIYWLRFTDECVLVMRLQRFVPMYFLQMGAYIRSLVPDLTFQNFKMPTSNYHVFKRADLELGNVLNFNIDMDDNSREAEFKEILARQLIPQLESLGTIDGIKTALKSKIGFTQWAVPIDRLVGAVTTHARFGYTAGGITHSPHKDTHPAAIPIGPEQLIAFHLYKRDNSTGTITDVDTIYDYNEAENWTKQWFKDISRLEVADIINRFLLGQSEHNEFKHFLSEPIEHDELIKGIRHEIREIFSEYSIENCSVTLCSDDKVRRIQFLSDTLKAVSSVTT